MKKLMMMLLCIMLLFTHAAASSDLLQQGSETLGLDKLADAAGAYSPSEEVPLVDLGEGLQDILDTGTAQLMGVVRKGVRSTVLLLAVVLLCALAQSTEESMGKSGGLQVVSIVGTLAITAISVTDVRSLIGMGTTALNNMTTFSKILLPTMAVATAASGSPGAGAARQLATMLFSSVLMNLITQLLIPLVYGYIAACVAHAAVGNEGLKRVAGVLKWVTTSVLAALLLAFTGYLTVSGVVAGTADAVAVKAAKFTVSSMVPVVGGILSDAAETVLAGAGILKNSVGVFGMLVILSMCIIPFLQLGIHYLTYKLAAALAATVAESRISGLIDGIGGAFGLILGMTGSCALLLLISMVSAVSMVAS